MGTIAFFEEEEEEEMDQTQGLIFENLVLSVSPTNGSFYKEIINFKDLLNSWWVFIGPLAYVEVHKQISIFNFQWQKCWIRWLTSAIYIHEPSNSPWKYLEIFPGLIPTDGKKLKTYSEK